MFVIKNLIFNNFNENNLEKINCDFKSFKNVYKKLVSSLVVSSQITQCRNITASTNNVKNLLSIFFKFSGISEKGLSILNKIGLGKKNIFEKNKNLIDNFNKIKLEQNENFLKNKLFLIISDNKYFQNKSCKFVKNIEEQNKEQIYMKKTTTKTIKFPQSDFKYPNNELKKINKFEKKINDWIENKKKEINFLKNDNTDLKFEYETSILNE
jgi:hypothetical protein